MSNRAPFIITISRLLGCGGSYLGQRIASRLGISYADREIVCRAAEIFHMSEEVGETLDEKMTPLWQSLLRTFEYGVPETCCMPPPNLPPSDCDFHHMESQIVRSIAQARSAVIVGRGGFYLLRENARHLSVFLHADIEFRLQRIQDIYDVSFRKAENLIETSDRDRGHYLRYLTGSHWTDARHNITFVLTQALWGCNTLRRSLSMACVRESKTLRCRQSRAEIVGGRHDRQ